MPEFSCRDCGASFTLPQRVLDQYPGWVPRQCSRCRAAARRPQRASSSSGNATGRSDNGPATGVFTDGSSVPNPGPGGWGVVYVVDDEIVAEKHGHDPDTTNNRMELTALLEALDLVPEGTAVTVYSDSHLAVKTITEWAEGWKRRGWKRKSGPVENLDLVKKVYEGYRKRPELELEWIKAHVGYRWNEYADELAARWRES
ncbi:MAG: ribonuclease H [Acidimicrobiia bacterium]|nr:ribonuclease H [Acidimicrobiia bacterium]